MNAQQDYGFIEEIPIDYDFTPNQPNIHTFDFDTLRMRYGDDKLREMSKLAGGIFFETYPEFSGREVSHGHIKTLLGDDFVRMDIKKLVSNLVKSGIPEDYIKILFKDPKRFLSAYGSYRKLVTFVGRLNKFKLKVNSEGNMYHA
jgi:hypothetical protein